MAEPGKEAFTTEAEFYLEARRQKQGEEMERVSWVTPVTQYSKGTSTERGRSTARLWHLEDVAGTRMDRRAAQTVGPPPGMGCCGHGESPKGRKWLERAEGGYVSTRAARGKTHVAMGVCLRWKGGPGDVEVSGPA